MSDTTVLRTVALVGAGFGRDRPDDVLLARDGVLLQAELGHGEAV